MYISPIDVCCICALYVLLILITLTFHVKWFSSRYESTSSDDSSSEESSSSGSEGEEDETERLEKNIKERRNDQFSNEGAEDVKRDVKSSGQENQETRER